MTVPAARPRYRWSFRARGLIFIEGLYGGILRSVAPRLGKGEGEGTLGASVAFASEADGPIRPDRRSHLLSLEFPDANACLDRSSRGLRGPCRPGPVPDDGRHDPPPQAGDDGERDDGRR